MYKILISVLLFMVGASGVLAQEDSELPFVLHSDDPVVAHNTDSSAWDGRYTDPGAVIYHDGQFHMFRNGFRAWPGFVSIGYLTSEDGLTWTEVSDEPVLTTDDVPYAEVAALASDVLVEDDGTWIMYFYTWGSTPGGGDAATWGIGRATASDPAGTWTVDEEPVLVRGKEDSWDSGSVSAPRVVKTDDGYVMYYSGSSDGLGTFQIGLATSEDGITWTKQEEPILTSPDGFYTAHQPMVQQTPDGWIMLYRQVLERGKMELAYAVSDDGVAWEPMGVVWNNKVIPRSSGFWYTALVYHDDQYYLYIEGGRGSVTDIYVATAQDCEGKPCFE